MKKMTKEWDDVFSALRTMIKWTREYKIISTCAKNYLSCEQYAKEYATVRFQLPRRSGHTTMVQRLSLFGDIEDISYDVFFKNPIILSPNERKVERAPGASFGGVFESDWHSFYGLDNDGLIVDCASQVPEHRLDEIYKNFGQKAVDIPDFVFLLMG